MRGNLFIPIAVIQMPRKPEIDKVAAAVVTVRFAKDIIELLDLLTDNRSKFVREATWEKIDRKMKEGG